MTNSPYHNFIEEYWKTLIEHHERIGTGWELPTWEQLSYDRLFEIKSSIAVRLKINIYSSYKITEEMEHHDWVLTKISNNWRFGNYNPLEFPQTHPMLKPFNECPKWFKEIANIFCSLAREWEKEIKDYDKAILIN